MRHGWLAGFASAAAAVALVSDLVRSHGVGDPWVLAGITVAGAGAGAVVDQWRRRSGDGEQQGEQVERAVLSGCLTVGGRSGRRRLPRVDEIADPTVLGVHRAAVDASQAARQGLPLTVPLYVSRDMDADLRAGLRAGGFVLLVGDSTAGKSRAAFEAARDACPGYIVLAPGTRDAVSAAVDWLRGHNRCLLWLDDLERFLGPGGD